MIGWYEFVFDMVLIYGLHFLDKVFNADNMLAIDSHMVVNIGFDTGILIESHISFFSSHSGRDR